MSELNVDAWLSSLPTEGDFPLLSPSRSFAHDEQLYDTQYQIDPQQLRPGAACARLLRHHECDLTGPAIEIGCGTGHLSVGFASASPFPCLVLTDPSIAFLHLTRRKLASHSMDHDRIRYAVLLAESLHVLPANVFSCIVLRSTLHHVTDIDKFMRDVARALKPGGCLIHQEPYAEGYLLMGVLIGMLPDLAQLGGVVLTIEQREKVKLFVDTMKFYCRGDLDKSTAEDKHVFRVEDLISLGTRYGLQTTFYSNRTFDSFSDPAKPGAPQSFVDAFRMYAKFCMSWDEVMLQHFDRFLGPHLKYIKECSAGNMGPCHAGVLIAKRV